MSLTYLEYDFKIDPLQPATDILIAELGELGFESFVENETGLLAYILKCEWRDGVLEDLFVCQNPNFEISWTSKEIEQQNWNAEWEKNFHPIKVGEKCMVRAPFHEAVEVDYDIVIEPKMSFGTGHHETTHMMLQHILDTDFSGKSVLDMGCGTGVLAILAKKKGASEVEAIDIDEWCYLNTQENVERNDCADIKVFQGDSSLLDGKKYDVVLANINRNILLEDIPIYTTCLKKGGFLFLSGFYLEDLDAISSKCDAYGLEFEKNIEKNNWVAAKYVN
ncbi:50S ribosomal protein L11 methyltransferase [Flagellimonas halotolerans]|uniref:Ribosomal protein L11 methyltransferase n=1 Tax=Flagellimonas halotolerans TaxID=3112164 RepID=A0ABU6IPD8_9FLAO|nr:MULTISPECIES: 50S ribosomal protein L11 methyltransferase [unclassified Allomuricauda]MEC3965180.1 50S ribosomal protein L11 methyltransferase [Muricauda sp. SYSU M86414]MEC4264975.1 50S ribosomal protein L11 methyltransferase [Muricauda sp. SYSU M84420]